MGFTQMLNPYFSLHIVIAFLLYCDIISEKQDSIAIPLQNSNR